MTNDDQPTEQIAANVLCPNCGQSICKNPIGQYECPKCKKGLAWLMWFVSRDIEHHRKIVIRYAKALGYEITNVFLEIMESHYLKLSAPAIHDYTAHKNR